MASASGYLERRRILTGSSELRRSLPRPEAPPVNFWKATAYSEAVASYPGARNSPLDGCGD